MEYLVIIPIAVVVVAIAVIGGLGELGLAATYGRIWGWLAERRARR